MFSFLLSPGILVHLSICLSIYLFVRAVSVHATKPSIPRFGVGSYREGETFFVIFLSCLTFTSSVKLYVLTSYIRLQTVTPTLHCHSSQREVVNYTSDSIILSGKRQVECWRLALALNLVFCIACW